VAPAGLVDEELRLHVQQLTSLFSKISVSALGLSDGVWHNVARRTVQQLGPPAAPTCTFRREFSQRCGGDVGAEPSVANLPRASCLCIACGVSLYFEVTANQLACSL
jgi:hypothetical protein